MKNRIHVHHFDLVPVSHDGDIRFKRAVNRLNSRRIIRKGFPLRDCFQVDDHVFESTVGSDDEGLQESPSRSGGDPAAVHGVGEGHEVVALGLGDIADQRDRPREGASVGHGYFLIAPT